MKSGSDLRHRWSRASVIGWAITSLLATLLVVTVYRASILGGDVAQRDRILQGIIHSGTLLSVAGILLTLFGASERGRLRWLAPLAAIAMAAIWFVLGELGLLWFLTGAHE